MNGKQHDTRDRLLKVAKILLQSDEDHPMNSDYILEKLKSCHSVEGERKALSLDIRALRENGHDIVSCAYKRLGYFMATHTFEAWELKVLVDAVISAKFLTESFSQKLLHKLLSTASPHTQQNLTDATPSSPIAKTRNISTQNNIDLLLCAIKNQHKVQFQYCSMGPNLKPRPRRNGAIYRVSPYSITRQQDFYYLICNYDGYDDFSYYRLDRIINLTEALIPLRPAEEFAGSAWKDSLSSFVSSTVHRHGGTDKILLKLKVPFFMLDNLYDEFGHKIIRTGPVTPCNQNDMYLAYIEAIENRGLYFLLLQYGENVEVLEPLRVRENYINKLCSILKKYD